jgi:hypothetical protein
MAKKCMYKSDRPIKSFPDWRYGVSSSRCHNRFAAIYIDKHGDAKMLSTHRTRFAASDAVQRIKRATQNRVAAFVAERDDR